MVLIAFLIGFVERFQSGFDGVCDQGFHRVSPTTNEGSWWANPGASITRGPTPDLVPSLVRRCTRVLFTVKWERIPAAEAVQKTRKPYLQSFRYLKFKFFGPRPGNGPDMAL